MTHAPFAILPGIALLLFGRKMFWLFVGAAGFAAGLEASAHLFQAYPQHGWIPLVAALVLGVIGVVLAIFLQKLAVGIAGFAGGVYLSLFFLQRFGEWNGHAAVAPGLWLAAIVGGIIGAVLMLILFEWTLIVLSSILGAALLSDALVQLGVLQRSTATIALLVLAVLGILVQGRLRTSSGRGTLA